MSGVQLGIFEARAARDSALARVESHADREWLDAAFAALRGYLETHETFHCDDFWTLGIARPSESRALGAVILRAAREGLMIKTGAGKPSVSSRLSFKPIWLSMVYRGEVKP